MDAFRAQDLPLPRVGVRCDTYSIIQTLLQDRRLLCMVPRRLMQTIRIIALSMSPMAPAPNAGPGQTDRPLRPRSVLAVESPRSA